MIPYRLLWQNFRLKIDVTIHDEARKVLTTDYIAYKQITYKRDNTDTGRHMTHLKAWIQFYIMSRTYKFDINKGGPRSVIISRVWMQFYVVPRTLDFILNVNTGSEYWMQFYVVPRTLYTHYLHEQYIYPINQQHNSCDKNFELTLHRGINSRIF